MEWKYKSQNIENKRVLLLIPSFFNYYKAIADELKKSGAKQVDVILENFVEKSLLYRFIYVKNDKTRKLYTEQYYLKKINAIKLSYDFVVVVRGEAITPRIMGGIKEKNPNAIFIMYQWDSVRNNPNCLSIQQFFDYIYTFDPEDADKYNWRYRPLFYIEAGSDTSTEAKEIDFAMVGTLYYKRAILFNKISDYCNKNSYVFFNHIYSPRFVFLLHKYLLRDTKYSYMRKSDVKFFSIDTKELNKIYDKSRVLVDYTADDQTGLTMRTIESLGHRCKLITNNKKVMESDIYRFGNIYIYDMDNFDIPRDFIESGYTDLPRSVNHYYSLSGWIESIFIDK